MRNNILSFLIASFVALLVLGSFHIINGSSDGTAMAAPGVEIRQGAKDTQKTLRKNITYHPENLLQLAGHDVRAVLKEPDLVRQDFPTVIWQYRNRSCVLDVYFSSSAEDVSGAPIVHYEIRARGKNVSDEEIKPSCMRNLTRSRNGLRMVDVSAIYKRH